jgi:ChrR Cupin-like domain
MDKPELEFQPPAADWTPAGDKVAGIWEQILSKDPVTGAHTRLLRFEPGVSSEPNGTLQHEFWEEVFIVRGDLTDLRLGETFTAGMYACRPPGMPHGPWSTTDGVLMVEFRHTYPSAEEG